MPSKPGSRADPSRPKRDLDLARLITVVSGLPRSGTSMMMQMLGAAGLELETDGVRVADADNPRGYFELEAVKRIRDDVSFLRDCVGRVVKIVSPLLPNLPDEFDYRIVMLERDLDEVLASQQRMLERGGHDRQHAGDAGAQSHSEAGAVRDDALRRAYTSQVEKVRAWIDAGDNVVSLVVPHRDVLRDPEAAARRVAAFLEKTGRGSVAGAPIEVGFDSRIPAMASVVDPKRPAAQSLAVSADNNA